MPGGYCASCFSATFCVYLCLRIFSHLCVFLRVPVCMPCVWHVLYRVCALSLCVRMHVCECEETTEGRPTESAAFRKVPE